MKFGRPWNVEGIRPRARETARAAARRSGLTVGEWLNAVIIEQAAEEGIGRLDVSEDGYVADEDLAALHDRLADLAKQLDRIERGNRASLLSQSAEQAGDAVPRPPRQIEDAIARLDQRLDQMLTEGRAAASEIERRVSSVDSALQNLERARLQLSYQASPAADEQRGHQTSDLAGLEQYLHKISHQIDGLSRPCDANAAVDALRADLADIKRSLSDAMPSRALEAIESEIRRLAERLDADRDCGIDPEAFAGLERGLAEVRDVLRGLTPAERLVGFDQAVQALSSKIDGIAAGHQDPRSLQQIDAAIAALRGIVAQVASSDALANVATDVRILSEKFERLGPPAGNLLLTLEKRIAGIADALESARIATGRTEPVGFESMLKSLSDKLERIQSPNERPPASSQLEDRITELVGKLDASEARLTNLGSIERGLAELGEHLEEFRTRSDPGPGAAPPPFADKHETLDALEHKVSELKQEHSIVARRTEDSLEAVHGTIGNVVDRLASIESDLRRMPPLNGAPMPLAAEQKSAAPPKSAPDPRRGQPDQAPTQSGMTRAQPESAAAVGAPASREAEARTVPQPMSAPNITDTASTADQLARSVLARLLSGKSDTVPSREAAPPVLPAEPAPQPSSSPDPTIAPASPVVAGATMVTTFGPPMKEADRFSRPSPLSPPARPPIDPELPPDTPLEPGMGRQRAAAAKAHRPVSPPAEAPATSVLVDPAPRSEFIAAARRAAQAAAGVRADTRSHSETAPKSDGKSFSQRVKSLFVGVIVLLIVAGVLRVGFNSIELGQRVADGDIGSAAQPLAARPSPVDPAIGDAGVAVIAGLKAEQVARSTALALFLSRASSLEASFAALNSPQASSSASVPAPTEPTAPPAAADNSRPAEITSTVSPAPAPAPPQAANEPDVDQRPAPIAGTALQAGLAAGNFAAAYEMGSRYAEGRTVAVNLGQAALWFDRAAKASSVPALFRLAALYEKGEGVKKDLQEARRLYIAAAEKGHAKAMHNLAVLYAEGIDGKPDYTTAAHWFQRAANRAVADSQYNLGILFSRGIGVEQNAAEAYKWFALAAAQGDQDAAKKRDDVAARLDAQKLVAARLAVQEFTAEPQPATAAISAAPPGGWDQVIAGGAAPKTKPASRVVVPQQQTTL